MRVFGQLANRPRSSNTHALRSRSLRVDLPPLGVIRSEHVKTIQRGFSASRKRDEQTLPSFAPRPTIAIKPIRTEPDIYAKNCLDRNLSTEATYPERIVKLSDDLYELRLSLNQNRSKQNQLSESLKSAAATRNQDIEGWKNLQTQAKDLKRLVAEAESLEQQWEEEMNLLAGQLPNITHPDTLAAREISDINHPPVVAYINPERIPGAPFSETTSSAKNQQLPYFGLSDTPGKSHVEIGTELGLLDFTSASKTSGWGWYFLLGGAVRLEQALIQYALDTARTKGWKLVSPPSIVYSHIAGACGFKPRDQNNEQQIYHLTQQSPTSLNENAESKAELCLAGTAEIPLAGMFANTAVPRSEFPKKMVGVSRCYRAEAGSHGLATKGLYRVHEFTKIELFAWTPPESEVSNRLFLEMYDLQHEIVKSLDIPARVLNMPTCDLGASAYRKWDVEAFMPSRRTEKYGGWGEVTSVTECLDYQARRLNARCKNLDGKLNFLWSLNGTALAVPRTIMAILENGWDEDRRQVRIPAVLHKYMGGTKVITKESWTED